MGFSIDYATTKYVGKQEKNGEKTNKREKKRRRASLIIESNFNELIHLSADQEFSLPSHLL
jgi:hypothetical protein